MYRIRQQDLPFVGLSHEFVGAERGDTGVSAYLVNAPPGRGPVLHRHPYDKVAFIREGRALWTVEGDGENEPCIISGPPTTYPSESAALAAGAAWFAGQD